MRKPITLYVSVVTLVAGRVVRGYGSWRDEASPNGEPGEPDSIDDLTARDEHGEPVELTSEEWDRAARLLMDNAS